MFDFVIFYYFDHFGQNMTVLGTNFAREEFFDLEVSLLKYVLKHTCHLILQEYEGSR